MLFERLLFYYVTANVDYWQGVWRLILTVIGDYFYIYYFYEGVTKDHG